MGSDDIRLSARELAIKVSEIRATLEPLLAEAESKPASAAAEHQGDLDVLRLLQDAVDLFALRFTASNSTATAEPGASISMLSRRAFVNVLNLLDVDSSSWPRKRAEHLAHGFSVVAANTYTLYGVVERGPLPLPSDMLKFPRRV